MKREEMTRIVKSELEYIPKGVRGAPQNELRRLYNARRRHDLVKTTRTKEETLQYCIQVVKRDHPEFVPEYDKDYFKIPRKGLLQRLRDWIKG